MELRWVRRGVALAAAWLTSAVALWSLDQIEIVDVSTWGRVPRVPVSAAGLAGAALVVAAALAFLFVARRLPFVGDAVRELGRLLTRE